MIGLLLPALLVSNPAQAWVVETIPTPEGEVVEVGGIAFPDDDAIAVSTRRGRVWRVDGALDGDASDASWTMMVEGLMEGLGLDRDGDDLVVLQRGELSRLRDVDGDHVIDEIDVVTQDWGLSENYHEYAFGLPRDEAGNRYVSLNLGFGSPEWWHGQSYEPYRGWILRVSPEGDMQPWATGFRSPCGLGFDAKGRLLATDNQGDWMPSSPLFVVERGGFHGHPAGLRWTEAFGRGEEWPDNREPPDAARVPPAIWIPYEWSRSTGNLVADTTGGRFGPFENQLFVAELTTGRVLRAEIEDVDGTPQGAVWPFMDRIGSVARVAFAPDGSLVCGLTNRGWGGLAPGSGLKRITWTGDTPLEMAHVRITPTGFDIEFTKPIGGGVQPDQVAIDSYDYNWWWKYGSPEQRRSPLDATAVAVSPDGRTLHVTIPELRAGRVVRMKLGGITSLSGEPLRTDAVAYTINRVPGGELRHVARKVTAPPLESMNEDESGWLRLTWGEPTELWKGDWRLAKDKLDPMDRGKFTMAAGNNVLVNDATDTDFVLRGHVASAAEVRASVMLPKYGAIAFGLPDGASLVVQDLAGRGSISVVSQSGEVVAEAASDAWRGPGQWHELEFAVEPGVLSEVLLDDIRVLEDVLCSGEAEDDWMRIAGDVGPAGVADIRIRNRQAPDDHSGLSLIPDSLQLTDSLWGGLGPEGMMLRGSGRVPLASPCPARGVIRGRIRFGSGSAAVLGVGGARIAIAEGRASEPTTGSVLGAAELGVRLIPPGVWYDFEAALDAGCLRIALNGLVVADECIDATGGAMAIVLQSGVVDVAELELLDGVD